MSLSANLACFISNEYFPAITRDNVELVTQPLSAVTSAGLQLSGGGADGKQRLIEVDAIVWATGFDVRPHGNRVTTVLGFAVISCPVAISTH